jgi:hypothetical protein
MLYWRGITALGNSEDSFLTPTVPTLQPRKGDVMKKLLVALAFLLDGVIVGLLVGLLLSTEQRLRLSLQLAGVIGGMEERMPEG